MATHSGSSPAPSGEIARVPAGEAVAGADVTGVDVVGVDVRPLTALSTSSSLVLRSASTSAEPPRGPLRPMS